MRTIIAFAVLATSLGAQTVSVGVGNHHKRFIDYTTAELMLSTSGTVNANVLVAADVNDPTARPTIIPRIGGRVTGYPVVLGWDVGFTLLPVMDYKDPAWHVGATATASLSRNWRVVTRMLVEPRFGWARTIVVKVDRTLWARFDLGASGG